MELKKTHIYAYHAEHGNMVDFGGYAMPVWYEGVIPEHNAVRNSCGIFDTSHMGRVWAEGPDVARFLDYIITNDLSGLNEGNGIYSVMCLPTGGIVDDLILYKMGPERFFVVYNAGNREKDFAWLNKNTKGFKVKLTDVSNKVAMIAVQGPKAVEVLGNLSDINVSEVLRFNIASLKVSGIDCLAARTGYTGEDGFEVYLEPSRAAALWNALLEAGTPLGLLPCGLGARDTLRLEAKMALYGNDIDDRHTVLEADLGWILKLEKGEFIGRAALAKQKAEGIRRKLIGFEMIGRGIGRPHYAIVKAGHAIGEVTSGGPAPWLDKNIGLGYVAVEFAAIGSEFDVLIRDNPVRARAVQTPFYKRKR